MSNIMIKAVLFDMDGVLIDTHHSVVAFWERWAAKYNLRLSEDDYVYHIFGTQAAYTLDHYFSMLTSDERQTFFQELAVYEQELEYQPVAGVVEFIRALKQESIPVGLVTSAEQHKVHSVTSQLGLTGVFDAVVTAELVQRGKPAPDCYRLGAEKLAQAPGNCLVFEDSRSGTQAAVAAGAVCVGVGPARALLPALGAVGTVADFHDIALKAAGDSLNLHIAEQVITIWRDED